MSIDPQNEYWLSILDEVSQYLPDPLEEAQASIDDLIASRDAQKTQLYDQIQRWRRGDAGQAIERHESIEFAERLLQLL